VSEDLLPALENHVQEITLGVNYYLNGHAAKFTADVVYLPRGFDNGLNLMNVPAAYHPIVTGIVILVALILNTGFERPNLRVKRGSSVQWDFSGSELHNVTVANGPIGFGSPNLDDDRTFTQRLPRSGNYKVFCALHPVQMTERIVVEGKRRWRK